MTHLLFAKSTPSCKVLFGLAALAGMLVAAPARADGVGKTHLAVDFDFNTALDTPDTKTGGGGALRLGRKFDLLLLSLTPELGGSYHAFSGNDDTKIFAGFLGARVGFGKILEPSAFAHLGFGHAQGVGARTAPMVDAGVALDFTLLPFIDLGLHGGYNVMLPTSDGGAFKYLTLGAQAALVF